MTQAYFLPPPVDQVQADRRDGPGQLHHRHRHPGHHPRSADEEHREPGSDETLLGTKNEKVSCESAPS